MAAEVRKPSSSGTRNYSERSKLSRNKVYVSKETEANEHAANRASFEAKKITQFQAGLSLPKSELMQSATGVTKNNPMIIKTSTAARMNQQIGATAFTWNNSIYLSNKFHSLPELQQQHVLEHEKAHIQQNKKIDNSNVIQRSTEDESWASRAWGAVASAGEAAVETASSGASYLMDLAKEKVLGPLRENEDYKLMTGVVGKDLFTGEAVVMEPKQFVQAAFKKADQEEYFKALDESGIFPKFFIWFTNKFKEMNLTWPYFKGIMQNVMNIDFISLGVRGSIAEFWKIMSEPVLKIVTFLKDVGKKVAELILDSFLISAAGQWLKGFLNKAATVYRAIFTTPIEFFKNVFSSIKLGFQQFVKNILTHLLSGVLDWLLGSLTEDGVELEKPIGISSVLLFALGVIGVSYANFRKIMVIEIAKNEKDKDGANQRAERKMGLLEESFELVQAYRDKGIAGVWKFLKDKIMDAFKDLKDALFEEIRNFLVVKIVTIAVEKVIALLVPAAAVLSAIKTGVEVLFVVIDQIRNALKIIEGIFDAIIEIASGALGRAANFIEGVLAKAIPIAIAFLAGLLGLGGIPRKIKDIILNVKKHVDKALGFLAKIFVKLAGPVLELLAKGAEAVDDAIDKVKGFVGSLLYKEEFKVGDHPHSFELIGDDKNMKLVMRSEPKEFVGLIDEIAKLAAADQKLKDNKEIQAALAEIKKEGEKVEQEGLAEYRKRKDNKSKTATDLKYSKNTRISNLAIKVRAKAKELNFEHLLNGTIGDQLDAMSAVSEKNYLKYTEKISAIVDEFAELSFKPSLSLNYKKEAIDIESETLDKWNKKEGNKTESGHILSKEMRAKALLDKLLGELISEGVGTEGAGTKANAEIISKLNHVQILESSLEEHEGNVAPYSVNKSNNSSHNARYDSLQIEADHSPQGAVLDRIGNFKISRGNSEAKLFAKSGKDLYNSGLTMNLARHRHALTRTYFSDAAGTIKEFFSDLFVKIEKKFGTNEVVENITASNFTLKLKDKAGLKLETDKNEFQILVRAQLKEEMQADQAEIQNILSRKWAISADHKKKIQKGSSEIRAQDFSSIK